MRKALMRWRHTTLVVLLILLRHDPSAAQQMVFPGRSWSTATPESVLVDPDILQAAIDGLDNRDHTIVIKNGRVIWAGEDVRERSFVASMTKSFTSTVLGLLIDDGRLTLDTPAREFVPALMDEYPDVTFRHLVTNTSGYNGSTIQPRTPWFQPPGSQFKYGESYAMLANALTQAAGESLEEIFTRRIAEPIQMSLDEFFWPSATNPADGVINNGEGGLNISAENAARLGHLFLNGGVWDQTRLISSEWIEAATQNQTPPMPVHPRSGTSVGPGIYGFGWWVVTPDWYEAVGSGNNIISVNPSTEMVVAALEVKSGPGLDPVYTSFRDRLAGATMPAFWDGQGDGQWDQIDPATGTLRWVTQTGVSPEIYPTYEATILSNVVTMGDALQIHSDRRITIQQSGTLVVEGSLDANIIDVDDNGSLVIDGHVEVHSLNVSNGKVIVHDSQLPINVKRALRLADDSELQFLIDDQSWDSPLRFTDPRVRPRFRGDLVLDFRPVSDLDSLVGATLNLFDWEGAEVRDEFSSVQFPKAFDLDLSQLYTNGEVTIVSVPEPSAFTLIVLVMAFTLPWTRRMRE